MLIGVPRGTGFYIVPCGRDHSTSIYRARGLREQIERFGGTVRIVYRDQVNKIPPGQIVILQRVVITPNQLELLKGRSRRLLFDIDDYITDPTHIPKGTNRTSDLANSMQRMLKGVHGVMCSTSELSRTLSKELGVKTYVRRNLLPQGAFKSRLVPRKGAHLNICYAAGSNTHDADFAMIEPVVEKVLQRIPSSRLIVVGYNVVSPALKRSFRSRVSLAKFMPFESYLRLLAREVKVAVVPLVDSKFNRCKSYVKALEATAMGVPVIASPVGEYGSVVKNNETGFIAGTPEEWEQYLLSLLESRLIRNRLGRNAMSRALKLFSTSDVGDLKKIFELTSRSSIPLKSLPGTPSVPAVKTKPRRRLRILNYRWHCGHQWELYHLAHDFTLAHGRHSMAWDYHQRPLRPNAKIVSERGLDRASFDVALLHFDEHVLSPNKTNGLVSPYWGEQFQRYVKELKIPKVAICHGTPPRLCRGNPTYDGDPWEVDEVERKRLVEFVGDMLIICNSRTAQKEWGFENSQVVYHGFDRKEYPQTTYAGGILCGSGDLHRRPWYRGWPYVERVLKSEVPFDHLGSRGKLPLKSVQVPNPKGVQSKPNVFAEGRFWNYKKLLASYSVFFNPTWFSPMPRTRAEAMMSGCCLVTTAFQDEGLWIENGVNGFASNNIEELIGILRYLLKNPEVAKKVGRQGREWASRNFSRARFLARWESIFNELTK